MTEFDTDACQRRKTVDDFAFAVKDGDLSHSLVEVNAHVVINGRGHGVPRSPECMKRNDIAAGRIPNSPTPSNPRSVTPSTRRCMSWINLRVSMIYFTLQGLQRDSRGVTLEKVSTTDLC